MALNPARSNHEPTPNSSPRPVEPSPTGSTVRHDAMGGPLTTVPGHESGVSNKKANPIGAQSTDPPWWRFVFFLFNGREGQWWSVILAVVVIVLLLLVVVAGLVLIQALLPGGGWISRLLGAGGSLTGCTLLWRRCHKVASR
jgi:hypothetical protein